MSDLIAAVATGNAVSAICVIRLSGEGAVDTAGRLFAPADGRPLADHGDRQLIYGTLRDRMGQTLDLCLCTVSRAPRSYTGEDTAELQLHGSPVLAAQTLEELFALGARQALPGEFTKRAFLNVLQTNLCRKLHGIQRMQHPCERLQHCCLLLQG